MKIDGLLTVEDVAEQISGPLRLTHASAIRRVYRAVSAKELEAIEAKRRVRHTKYFFLQEAVNQWISGWFADELTQCG